MQNIQFTMTDKSVTVFVNGKPTVVDRSNKVADSLVQAIREQNEDRIREIVDSLTFKSITSQNGSFVVEDGVVRIDGEQVPDDLTSKILLFRDEQLPFEPLVNFWRNLRQNPSFRARRDLFAFLENAGHPITEDGCFLAYKRVRMDWMDIHSGTNLNTVGSTLRMDRTKVDDDPNRTCSSGLHVASREYADVHFGGGQGRLVICKVNPRDVVAIPSDYANQKMRCCEYTVIAEDEGMLRQPYVPDESQLYNYDPDDGGQDWSLEEDCNCEECDPPESQECLGDCDGCHCSHDGDEPPTPSQNDEELAKRVFNSLVDFLSRVR